MEGANIISSVKHKETAESTFGGGMERMSHSVSKEGQVILPKNAANE